MSAAGIKTVVAPALAAEDVTWRAMPGMAWLRDLKWPTDAAVPEGEA